VCPAAPRNGNFASKSSCCGANRSRPAPNQAPAAIQRAIFASPSKVPRRPKSAPFLGTLRRLVDLLEGFSGQGSASLTSPEQLASPCFFNDAVLPGRACGPGRLPAYARFLGGDGRPANLFRLGRLDRCAGSTRKRIERNGLLSSSGVPSWGAKPARRIEAGLESRKAATWGSFAT
jgi:hypothetical protein